MLFWAYVFSGWIVCLVMLPILSRRYMPAKAWAWLVVMFLLPWVGLGLYLLLGENPLGRRRMARYQRVARQLEGADLLHSLDEHVVTQPMSGHFTGLERLAIAGGTMRPVGGNHLELITDLPRAIDRIIDDINHAQHHAHIMFYIYRDDETGRKVADALARAASRGVKCRLIADAIGARNLSDTLSDWLEQRGVEVRFALPLHPMRSRLIRIDVRNHRKIVVIDGKIAYTGSGNITNPDYGHDLGPFHELMVRMTGPIVAQLQLAFLEDWCKDDEDPPDTPALFPTPQVTGSSAAQLVPSGPRYPHAPLRDAAVAAIHDARHRVTITTPYLIPDMVFLTAVRLAVFRGVRVDLIYPEKTDAPLATAAARPYFRDMIADGIHIHMYQPSMLHAKIITIDRDIGMIGSGNFDIRSFRLNVEANLLVYSSHEIDRLVDLQDQYITHSQQLTDETLRNRPLLERLGDDCAKLLSPLI